MGQTKVYSDILRCQPQFKYDFNHLNLYRQNINKYHKLYGNNTNNNVNLKRGKATKVIPKSRIPFKFTGTAAKRMQESGRRIPIHTMEEIIKFPKHILKDPQGSNGLMYYSRIFRNKKQYNVEILYDKASNQIMHFKYTQDPLGPLKIISK